MTSDVRIPNVLSIAGSDPSGGAGIQADLKTFAALGCHGMAVLTALTAQNTQGVGAVHLPPPDFVAKQIDMVFADIDVAAVKIGMIGSPEIVTEVASALRRHRPRFVVVDPVLVATSGAILGDTHVIEAMRRDLFDLATLVTPNLAEAARLAGTPALTTRPEVEAAARTLRASGSAAWLLTGGDVESDSADDLLDDGNSPIWLSAGRVPTLNTHGTGCTLSSAITAALAKGRELRDAVSEAKAYLSAVLAGADRLNVGHGPGPVDHFVRWRKSATNRHGEA